MFANGLEGVGAGRMPFEAQDKPALPVGVGGNLAAVGYEEPMVPPKP